MWVDYWEVKYLYQCNREIELYIELKKKYPRVNHDFLVKEQKRLLGLN